MNTLVASDFWLLQIMPLWTRVTNISLRSCLWFYVSVKGKEKENCKTDWRQEERKEWKTPPETHSCFNIYMDSLTGQPRRGGTLRHVLQFLRQFLCTVRALKESGMKHGLRQPCYLGLPSAEEYGEAMPNGPLNSSIWHLCWSLASGSASSCGIMQNCSYEERGLEKKS